MSERCCSSIRSIIEEMGLTAKYVSLEGVMSGVLFEGEHNTVTFSVSRDGLVTFSIPYRFDDWKMSTSLHANGIRTWDPRTWWIYADGYVLKNRTVDDCARRAIAEALRRDAIDADTNQRAAEAFRRASMALADARSCSAGLEELQKTFRTPALP